MANWKGCGIVLSHNFLGKTKTILLVYNSNQGPTKF